MKTITEEAVSSLKDLLVPVAEKIGETAEWGWEVVVKQMYVYGALGVIWVIISIIALIFAWKFGKKAIEKNCDWKADADKLKENNDMFIDMFKEKEKVNMQGTMDDMINLFEMVAFYHQEIMIIYHRYFYKVHIFHLLFPCVPNLD
ncbi:hypothetical protein LCGC14_2823290 [marine sediment metagenome]|uniref:Uncharacterized protein n=1 Tax=marine sediment metagenome TaxID=412755 RepID=A0A0F8YG59_9ZZZZ